KFSSIGGMAICAVTLDAKLVARTDSLACREALPIAIFFVLEVFEGSEFADGFVHKAIYFIVLRTTLTWRSSSSASCRDAPRRVSNSGTLSPFNTFAQCVVEQISS